MMYLYWQKHAGIVTRMGIHVFSLLLICQVFCVGCAGEFGPELVPVTGTITLDGQPVQQAVIRFLPDNSKGTKGPIALGVVESSGRYSLTSPGGRDGVIEGHHLVTIICEEQAEREVSEGVFETVGDKCHVPAHYASEKTSELTAEVTTDSNEVNFDLRSK